MLSKSEYENMELSTKIIIEEAQSRGIKVEILDEIDNFIRLTKGEKVEYIKQATKTSVDTYISPVIMENKEVTKKILVENNIRVPKGKIYYKKEEAEKDYQKYAGNDVIVKPNSTNFGLGISFLKKGTSQEEYLAAIKHAFELDKAVIIEEFLEGDEFRFLVIGDRVSAILQRVPANVTGDGIKTIKELVEIKNNDPKRGTGYKKPLQKIELGFIEKEFLKSKGFDENYIPKEGEKVYLRKNSNISNGGDSIDFTDDFSDKYKEIAVKAAKSAFAKICGVDIIVKDKTKEPTPDNYGILELNFNPAIFMHKFPYIGKERTVEKEVLDLLGF